MRRPTRPTVSASSAQPPQSTSTNSSLPYREQMVRRITNASATPNLPDPRARRVFEGMVSEVMRGHPGGSIARS